MLDDPAPRRARLDMRYQRTRARHDGRAGRVAVERGVDAAGEVLGQLVGHEVGLALVRVAARHGGVHRRHSSLGHSDYLGWLRRVFAIYDGIGDGILDLLPIVVAGGGVHGAGDDLDRRRPLVGDELLLHAALWRHDGDAHDALSHSARDGTLLVGGGVLFHQAASRHHAAVRVAVVFILVSAMGR